MSYVPRSPVVVMASGCFDLLHRGHINLLWRARQLGDVLVVGVVSDAGAKAYKGRYPSRNYAQRIGDVKRLDFVGAVELQYTTDPSPLLERFLPDILVHGDDWDTLKAGQETVERMGIRWVLLPYTPGVSTTLLRERVPPGQGEPAVGTASAVATGDLPSGAPAIVHVYVDGIDPKNGGHQPEGAPCPTS